MTQTLPRKAGLVAAVLVIQQASSTLAQGALEEVIVTAHKREQSAQDVPVALTAVGASTIVSLGIPEFQDIARVSPSLTMSDGNNKQQSSINIRGIGTNVFSIALEPSVAVIIDNVSQVQPGGRSLPQAISVPDAERVRPCCLMAARDAPLFIVPGCEITVQLGSVAELFPGGIG